jgi:hypothetical protein
LLAGFVNIAGATRLVIRPVADLVGRPSFERRSGEVQRAGTG